MTVNILTHTSSNWNIQFDCFPSAHDFIHCKMVLSILLIYCCFELLLPLLLFGLLIGGFIYKQMIMIKCNIYLNFN